VDDMKNGGRMFVKGFIRSFLFFVFFIAICTLSYKTVMHFWGIDNEAGDAAAVISPYGQQEKREQQITEAKLDDVSRHLIFCVDEDDGSIKKAVLEIFNCPAHKLYYITIPIKTQFTLSPALHKRLVLVKPSIPQFLKLSAITAYIPDDTAYEYGVLMIEDLLNISVSYYSAVPQSVYDSVFVTENTGQEAAGNDDTESTYPREIFSPDFLEFLQTIKTETQLREYIKEIYNRISSNLSFEDKLNYMESYLNTPEKNIFFEVIAGKDSNSEYTIDTDAALKQLQTCMEE